MAPKTSFQNNTVLAILTFMFLTIMPIKAYGFTMELIPIDSIDSIHFPKNITTEERHLRLSEISKARIHYLRSMTSTSTINSTEDPVKPGLVSIRNTVVPALNNFFITQFYIGSETFSPYLLVDSGGDITWVQCDRCTNCFLVRGGNFKYYESSSFRPLACADPHCLPRICRQGICHYEERYTSSSTKGWVSTDRFVFSGTTQTNYSFPNLVFGCGLDNQNVSFGFNDGPNNPIAGVFGLGAGRRSILRQLTFLTKMRFSYCLPPGSAPRGTHTYLHFGDDANFRGDLARRARSTRLLLAINVYRVNLLGLSVAGRRLNIDPAVFRMRRDYSGGFAIDTGCPHSVLVDPAYRILKDEMITYFRERYPWIPRKEPRAPYDLCYLVRQRGNYTLPSVTYHFEGADLVLEPERVFINLQNVFCMTIFRTRDPGPSPLGAFQQANCRFLFDVEAGRISFVRDNCRYN